MLVVRADAPVEDAEGPRRGREEAARRDRLHAPPASTAPPTCRWRCSCTAAGIKMRHLPTTGGGPMMNAMLGGHAQVGDDAGQPGRPHVKAGKLRLLAHTGAAPIAAFPDVPSFKSLGYDVEYTAWAGLVAPKGTPPHVIKILRDADAPGGEGAGGRQRRTPSSTRRSPTWTPTSSTRGGPRTRSGWPRSCSRSARSRARSSRGHDRRPRRRRGARPDRARHPLGEPRSSRSARSSRPGPAYMPVVLAALLIAFGVAVVRDGRGAPPPRRAWAGTEWRHARRHLRRVRVRRVGARAARLPAHHGRRARVPAAGRRAQGLGARGSRSPSAMAWGSFFVFDTLLRVPLPRGPFGF